MAALTQPISLTFPGLQTVYEFFESQSGQPLQVLYREEPCTVQFINWDKANDQKSHLILTTPQEKEVRLELGKNSLQSFVYFENSDSGHRVNKLEVLHIDPMLLDNHKTPTLLSQLARQIEIVPTEKLKGEINEEFEMRYVGRDRKGNYYQCFNMVESIESKWLPLKEEEYLHLRNNLDSLPILTIEENKILEDKEINLFAHPELWPEEVQHILYEYQDADNDYIECQKVVDALEAVGYTCEYDLNGELSNLRKLEPSELHITTEIQTQEQSKDHSTQTTTTMTTEKKEELHLSGYIGKDAVKINEYSDKKRATFQIGISNGEKTEWHSIQAWGKQAEKVAELQTGAKVTVHGFKDSYTPESGKTFEYIKANSIDLHIKQNKELVVSSFYTETPKNKEIGHLIGYHNYIENGESKSDKIYIDAYGKNMENLKAMNPQKGDKIVVEYDSKLVEGKDKVFENNVVVKAEMKERKLEIDNSAGKEAEPKAESKAEAKETKKAPKATKGKDTGMER